MKRFAEIRRPKKSSVQLWTHVISQRIKSFFFRLFRICYCGKEMQHDGFEMAMTPSGGKVPGGSQTFVWPVGYKCWRQAASLNDKLTDAEKEALDYSVQYAEDDED